MMQQPVSSMVPPPTMGVLQQQQYQQQQQWQQPPPQQQPQYQVPPPQQPQQQPSPASAAAYYYQQPQVQQQQAAQYGYQYATAPAAAVDPNATSDGIRSLWIGDLQYWMDETYLSNCFAHTGEVVSIKVIRNKQTAQSEGYGFIEFVSHAAAEKNLQNYNGALMPNVEQNFRLNWASMGTGEKRSDDSPEYTVFVGDLAADVTDYMLQETFRVNYPSVKGAKVVTDRLTGRTKGYGFVKFADESEQTRAMHEMNGRYCSTRPMRIGPAASKKAVGVGGAGVGQQTKVSYQGSPGTQNEDDPTNTTLFVGNLDANVTDDHLRQIFGNYGQLLHVKIPVGKRCGFVQFADRSCAEEALRQLNGTQLAGQSIRLSWGRSTTNKQPQADPNQWSGGGNYYGYAPGYDTYGYAPAAAQDPNMYYAGHPGYGSYPQQPQQQQPQ